MFERIWKGELKQFWALRKKEAKCVGIWETKTMGKYLKLWVKKGKVKQGFIYENAQKKVLLSWKVFEKSLILLNKKVYEPCI